MELEDIETVKEIEQGNRLLINGTVKVPKSDGNTVYKMILKWVENGGTIEPEFTAEELKKNELTENIATAKEYLNKTDKRMTIDYFDDMTTEMQLQYTQKRAEARKFVRENEV